MKKLNFVILIFLFSNLSFSQNLISIVPGVAYFISNSENDLTILKKKKLEEFYFFGLSYESVYFSEYKISIDYSFSENDLDGVEKSVRTDQTGNIIGEYSIDYFLINHTLDFLLISRWEESEIYFGIGPSFILTNRGLEFSPFFNDILASYGVGLCSTIETDLQSYDTFSIRGMAKLRYTHSILYDEGIRKLNGYSQEFISVQMGIRFMFNFKQ